MSALLDVVGLKVSYRTAAGTARAVDGVSLDIAAGETLGLVGESGCGKTTVGRAIIGVLPPNARIDGGVVRFKGRNLLGLDAEERRQVRGRDIAVVPQSAMNALNPVRRVGRQIEEVLVEHSGMSARDSRERTRELFTVVDLEPARIDDYPHQFSGGMRQRALMAMALALDPALLIADEPTTALDVLTQDGIFRQLRAIRQRLSASMLLITHDMGLVAENCDRVAVMYAGRIVEYARVRHVFKEPLHPYTLGLANAFPSLTRPRARALISIPGAPPSLLDPPAHCRFAARCPYRTEVCLAEDPPFREVAPGHFAACHHADRADAMREQAADSATWEPR